MSQNPSLEEARRRRLARLGVEGRAETSSRGVDSGSSSVVSESGSPRRKEEEKKVTAGSKRSLATKEEVATMKTQEKKVPRESTPAQVDKLLRRILRLTIGGSVCPTGFIQLSEADLGGSTQLSQTNIGLGIEARLRKEPNADHILILNDLYGRLRDEARAAKSRADLPANLALVTAYQESVKIAARSIDHQAKSRETMLVAFIAEPGLNNDTASATKKKLRPEFCKAVLSAVTEIDPLVKTLAETTATSLRGKLIPQPSAQGPNNTTIPRPPREVADELISAGVMRGFADAIAYIGKARVGPILAETPLFQKPPLVDASPSNAINRNVLQGMNQLQGGLTGFFRAMARASGQSQGRDLERTTVLGLACRAADFTTDFTLVHELAALLKHRQQRNALEPRVTELGRRVSVLREGLEALFSVLVKASEPSRDAVLQWLAALLARSVDAEATVRDHRDIPSQATRLNACAACLRLCRPILSKPEREQNCQKDISFIENSALGKAAFANGDLTRIYARGAQPAATEEDTDAIMTDRKDDDEEEDSDAEMYDDDDDDDDLKAALAMSMEKTTSNKVVIEEYNFVTTLFFLTLRALRLGPITEIIRHQDEQDRLFHFARRAGMDDERVHLAVARGLALETMALDPDTLDDALRFSAWTSRWLMELPEDELKKVPEHVLEDVALTVTLICRFRPDALRRVEALTPYLQLAIHCIGQQEKIVRSPHLRDKLLQGIYECFLPVANQSDVFARPRGGLFRTFMRGNGTNDPALASAEANVLLLLEPPATLQNANRLAPAILWMFGDAEHLGFYDVTPARLRIAALIRQLWTSPFHKTAFRAIATDEAAFVTFANGLLNETNRLVAVAIEKLPQVRDHQVRTGVLVINRATEPELAALRDEYQNADQARREELDQRFDELDRHLGLDLRLCTETLGLVELLTTDETVSGAFFLPELRARLAAMLLSVMRSFTGRRSLNIKIQNPEKYGFDPRDILTRVGRVATQFATRFAQLEAGGVSSQFALALAESGYFDPNLLLKTVQTLRKINSLSPNDLDALNTLADDAASAYATLQSEGGLEDIAPENFVDPLTCTLMKNPVKLPSGHICDSTSIKQHLLNEKTDPFTRMPLEDTDLTPLPELAEEIQKWIQEQREIRRQN